jgi:hypothetical protein
MSRLQPAVIRRRIALLASAPVLLVAGCRSEVAPAASAAMPPPLASCDLPPDSVRHVIVLDQSGSMRPVWPTVRRQLAAIIEGVPDGSWVHVEGFSDRVVTLMHDARLGAANRANAVQQALRVAEPAPQAPTDLGRAMDAALDDVLLARERGRGRLTLLFFITDGRHDPAAGSPYRDTAQFDRLRAQWTRRMHEATIHPFVFAIPIGSGIEGADLVRRTIPGTIAETPRRPAEIADVVNGSMQRIGKDVKRALVEADVARAADRLSARVAGEPRLRYLGDAEGDVVLRSSATCVTYAVTGGAIGAGPRDPAEAVPYHGRAHGSVLVPPGGEASVRVTLRGTHPAAHRVPWGGAVSDTLDASPATPFALTALVGFEPRRDIEALIVDATPDTAQIQLGGALRREAIAWPAFLVLAGLPLLVLLMALYAALPAKPGALRPMHVERLPRAARGGARVLRSLPDGTAVRVSYRRASRLRSRRRVRLAVQADRAGAVAVASEREGGTGHELVRLPADAPHELSRQSYIVWADNGDGLPDTLAPGEVDLLPGYYWSGRS